MMRFVLVLSVLACGCTASVQTTAKTPAPAPPAQPAPAPAPVAEPSLEPAPEPVAAAPNTLPPDGVLGVIDRQGLVVIIDQGLGRLFQRLKVSPFMQSGRFVGFQITALDPQWEISQLRTGDVITALNGQVVERPEQAMAAFERLRQADELVVDLLREGVPATLRFRIE